jgi:raffinose/stachyose/melibiose transport system substrate-binding protein
LVAFALACSVFALGIGPIGARPAGSDHVTITLLTPVNGQPAFDVLIANFERVYPNITVNPTYVPSTTVLDQLQTVELGAGGGPDLLDVTPGCGSPHAVCALAKLGALAPLVSKRWTQWSMPGVISLSEYDHALYAFLTTVGPQGVFTNDGLFRKLGLAVPQTFEQLLAVCQRAKADGTVALELDGAAQLDFEELIMNLAVETVYGKDPRFVVEQKAGKASFDRTAGWRRALQDVIDMNNAGCFEPGASGTPQAAAIAQFAQGQALMIDLSSGIKGLIDADSPQFSYSFHPFLGGAGPVATFVHMGIGVGVNAHSSPQNQAAAQAFIDFIARPKQNALYAQIKGSLSQYEFLHKQIPGFMSSFAPVFANNAFEMDPSQNWWNPNVLLAIEQDEVGLLTGQTTVDDVLNAMDAAWKQGPA